MKIFKMIREFFLKWSRSSKIVQNVIFSCQTIVSDFNDLSHEIFAIDVLTAINSSLKDCRKYSLRLLQL